MKLLKRIYESQSGPLGIAAICAWMIVSYVLIYQYPKTLDSLYHVWTSVFLVTYFVGMQLAWLKNTKSRHTNFAGLLVIGMSILGIGWSQPQSTYLVLIVIFAGILPYFLSVSWSVLVGLVLFALTLSIAIFHWQQPYAILNMATYLSFSIFAFFAGLTAHREAQLRQELALANDQLLATQQLLTDSAVNDERLRISRDLHDAIGHHLTAMSLQLEVARRLSKDRALEHIEQAHSLTKLLLADVREVVSDLREVPSVDIRRSLKQLASSARATVNLMIDTNLEITKTKVLEAVFRLVQEMITNSNRYSRTGQLSIHLSETDKEWCLRCDDGGSENLQIVPGSGISGMRERAEQLNGQFNLTSDKGLHYNIRIPKHD
jgi:two-component system sensor histidine kinase DesK